MTNINIERTLGRIEGQLTLILEEQKRDRLEFKREQENASRQLDNQANFLVELETKVDMLITDMKHDKVRRKDQHQRLETIERKQDTAEKDRADMSERLKIVEKNTAEFNKWKERGVGALMVISGVTALIGGAFAASWQKILDIFR